MCEEENDLYFNSCSDDIFTVNLLASDAALLNNTIEPKTYALQLTMSEIQLKYLDKNGSVMLITKWPYRYIRKYGHRDGKFTFEAGRKCDMGEGVVKLQHTNPNEVVRCMSAKMKSMKKLLQTNDLDFSECDLLKAAICMEAGSRSPLPPSFSSYQNNFDTVHGHLLQKFLSKSPKNDEIEPMTSNTFESFPLSPSLKSLIFVSDGNSESEVVPKSNKKISITVNVNIHGELRRKKHRSYDKLDFFPSKSSHPVSDYQTIITITTPQEVNRKQTDFSQMDWTYDATVPLIHTISLCNINEC